MADIIIYGMKMPISGATFRVVEDLEGNKFLTSADCMNGLYYPLGELLPHGRLIDADVLLKDVRKNSESYFADYFAHEWVDVAPTIIPASERE